MRDWNLSNQDPVELSIAADARLASLDYPNDQIWELNLAGGEPPALALYTTFGLRARSMRLFPQFRTQETILTDPQSFFRSPRITHLYPNFISVRFSPFAGIDVLHEVWAASSQVLAGRFTFLNQNPVPMNFGFEWTAVLNPLGEESHSISITPMGINHVLTGMSEDIEMVCFMTGGPSPNSGPLPSLALDVELRPGSSREITWALASLGKLQESYELARLTTAREWEAEIARIELVNESRKVEIHTGDPDWDAALAVSQKTAASLLFTPGGDLPQTSFVLARTSGLGCSLRGDGSDYTHLWNGQPVLDTWYLCGILMPGMEDICAGFIENFLSTRGSDGFIDWKPGMAGQRSKRLAQPLLATTAWQVHEAVGDQAWLEKIYPDLISFAKLWFDPQHDSDQDGYPEWDHPYQPGLDSIPLFHPWEKGAQGVEPQVVESPALAAFLYRECLSLSQMASLLGKDEDLPWLGEAAARLREHVENQWDGKNSTYRYWDALTHQSPLPTSLLAIEGSGTIPLRRAIEPAQRLLVRIKTSDERTRQTHIIIHGKTVQGETTEDVPPRQIRWLHGEGRYTTRNHFNQINEIIVRHIHPSDTCEVGTIDFTSRDISLLLPLWAGIPEVEYARDLIENTIFQDYLEPYGIPVCPRDHQDREESTRQVSLPWNQLLVEGLLMYGYRARAVTIIERLMRAVIHNLKETHHFTAFYHARTGSGSGDRSALSGLAPVGLFLRTLGLVHLSPKKIVVEGFNPFPWPVTVQYRGTNITFSDHLTQIEFPGGQVVTIDDPRQHIVTLP